MKEWFYAHNYYINGPLSFKFKSKIVNSGLKLFAELFKIGLVNAGLMKPVLNERLFERPFILANIPKKEKLKILDLGCGDSIFALELQSLGHEVWGADPKDYYFRDKIKFVKGDFVLNRDKFQKNYFDVITAVSSIEHFGLEWSLGEKIKDFDQNRKDIEAINVCKQLLKKGGYLMITTPYGKKSLFDNERVYDEKEIGKLTGGLKLVKKEIVRSENELINDKTNHPSIFMGVFKK